MKLELDMILMESTFKLEAQRLVATGFVLGRLYPGEVVHASLIKETIDLLPVPSTTSEQ